MSFENENWNMKKVLIPALFIFILCSGAVLGQTVVTLDQTHIIQDSYVDENLPANNFGSNVGLGVDSRSGKRQYTFIDFDTSSLNGSTISNAEICLTGAGLVNVAQRNITTHHLTTAWNENTLTWNNKPAYNSTPEGNRTGDNAFWGVNSVNCINITNAFIRTLTTGNISIVLDETSGNSVGTAFYSSNYPTISKRPYINVTITAGNIVSACANITTSGNYIVNQSISADVDKCINITADDVNLDINNHVIDGNDLVSTIYIDNQITGTEIHNIIIQHGNFTDGSTYIDIRNADGINITENTFMDTAIAIYGENVGLENVLENNSFIANNTFGNCTERCIDITSNYYLGIIGNYFTSSLPSGKNIVLDMSQNSTIEQNLIGKLDVIGGICTSTPNTELYWGWSWLNPFGWGFNLRGVEEISCTSLTYNGLGAYSGVECNNCTQTHFIDNIIYGMKDVLLTGESNYNRFAHNQFLSNPSVFNGCFWGVDTYYNYACGNEGNIIDSGTNNVIDASCSLLETNETGVCNAGYFCTQDLSVEKLVYVTSGCGKLNETICNCVSNGAESYCDDTGDITTPESSITSLIPIGSMFGVPALDLLFTPFLLMTIILVVGGIYAEKYAKSNGQVFFLVLLIGVLGLTYFNIYPVWFGVLIAIGIGAVVVNMFRKVTG